MFDYKFAIIRKEDNKIMTNKDLADGNTCFNGAIMDYDGDVLLSYNYPEDGGTTYENLDLSKYEVVWMSNDKN